MKIRLIVPLVLAGFVAGCNSTDETAPLSVVVSHVDPTALSSAFVNDWSIFEAAASALRDSDPRYTVQKFTANFVDGVYRNYYSLKHGRVEYAHAAGLTGTGQIISIIDNGFLQTHQEFAGKSIDITPGYAPSVSDHGTFVASIAAGIAASGNMIGVAPGASLALGDFDPLGTNNFDFASVTAATNRAASIGAVVQNNSWGFVDSNGVALDVTTDNFNSVFGTTTGNAYLNSLKNMAQNSVIVFALPNENDLLNFPARTHADLMGALPVMVPSLQNSWIAVVNAVPVFSGDTITSATMISPNCFEAAAWCIAADGTSYGASATGNADYVYWTGTSFAAPQISGGIALLAEAFPTLSSEELRARMLASADNGFFDHDGYVEFTTSVKHGFNSEFGHGFMNLKAALSPIGGSFVPRANGNAAPLNQPTLASTGMAGDVVSRSLSTQDLLVLDGMGAQFDVPANLLTADVVQQYDPLASIENLFSADMNSGSFDPLRAQTRFASVNSGQQVDFETDNGVFSLLVPTSQDSAYGVSLAQRIELGAGSFEFGISAIQENSGFAGMKSLLENDHLSSVHGAVNVAYNVPLGPDQNLLLSGTLGVAMPSASLTDMAVGNASYNALGLSYSAGNVLGTGDRVSLGLALPNAIQSGTASVTMPVARSDGGVDFTSLSIPLAASARQFDISASYGLPVFDGADIVFSAVRSLNDGNVAGKNSTEAGFGFRFSF